MALKAHLEFPSHIVEGRRQPRRALRMETSGVLAGGKEANVTVHNISAAGLLIETDQSLKVSDLLSVDLPEVGPVGAEIVWVSENLFGCAFQQALGEAALAAAQLRAPVRNAEAPPAFGTLVGDPLGVRLNRLRRERGLTLAQVAASLGVSKPTVWAWEKGKARPLPERLAAIAEVLGVSRDELEEPKGAHDGKALVEECRQRIAAVYGTESESVRIMIEM